MFQQQQTPALLSTIVASLQWFYLAFWTVVSTVMNGRVNQSSSRRGFWGTYGKGGFLISLRKTFSIILLDIRTIKASSGLAELHRYNHISDFIYDARFRGF